MDGLAVEFVAEKRAAILAQADAARNAVREDILAAINIKLRDTTAWHGTPPYTSFTINYGLDCHTGHPGSSVLHGIISDVNNLLAGQFTLSCGYSPIIDRAEKLVTLVLHCTA
jgi:hypothetical protein